MTIQLKKRSLKASWISAIIGTVLVSTVVAAEEVSTSYAPVVIRENFDTLIKRMKAEKRKVEKRHNNLLKERYDLSNRPAKDVTMSGGKRVQAGVRVKLPKDMTWDTLAIFSSDEIRSRGLFPKGFMPLPHPNHAEGGLLFPEFHIKEIKKQEGRDLTRFDLDFAMPDHFLPEFPSPIYLTTRPDLGDFSNW